LGSAETAQCLHPSRRVQAVEYRRRQREPPSLSPPHACAASPQFPKSPSTPASAAPVTMNAVVAVSEAKLCNAPHHVTRQMALVCSACLQLAVQHTVDVIAVSLAGPAPRLTEGDGRLRCGVRVPCSGPIPDLFLKSMGFSGMTGVASYLSSHSAVWPDDCLVRSVYK
jgi:hypothetical protein